MKTHPATALFPMMGEDELRVLADDIATNGLLHPVVVLDGKVLDGRNRLKACAMAGVSPHFVDWSPVGDITPASWVIATNLKRRHLTKSQCAAIAVNVLPMLEKEARKRQAHGATAPGKTLVEGLPQASDKSRDQAGAMFGVSGRMVSDAKRLKDESPELFKEVKTGETTLTKALRSANHAKRREAPELPTDRYRVFYADPPWSYGNSGLQQYGHASHHYPSMTIGELCALPVAAMVEADAVLFLWVTSPLLEDAFRVVADWGFSYRTSIVWNKDAHNFGHYVSVRHEFLLICVRGSCTPDIKELLPSVVTIKRTGHSEKPEAFRAMIDKMYPKGRRIELFARGKPAAGWDTWGNE